MIIVVIIFKYNRARFHPNYTEKEAAKAISEVVETACLNFRYISILSIISSCTALINKCADLHSCTMFSLLLSE